MIIDYEGFQIDVWQDGAGAFSYAFIDPCDGSERRPGQPLRTMRLAVIAARRHMGRCLRRPYTQRGEIASGQWWQPDEDKAKKDATLKKYRDYFSQVQYERDLDRWMANCSRLILTYPDHSVSLPPRPSR